MTDGSIPPSSDATSSRVRWLLGVIFALALCVFAAGLHTASPAQAATTQGQAIVNAAAQWAGTQYCWDGGNQNGPTRGTPDPTDGGYQCAAGTSGFDCTGLTLYAVYQATGGAITLSHDSHQATSASGQTITNPANLEPGDVVYFGGTLSNFVHSGVYAGVVNGAPSFWSAVTEGIGVKLETMAWEEAANGFVGAERFWSGSSNNTGVPPDGTLVSYQGMVYRIAGGAPLYVSNWAAVGGPQTTEALSASQWAALNAVPADGTLIASTATGMVYEVAGGAPLYVSNWAAIGGARSVVGIDQWDLDNTSNPAAHLRAYPADGTFLNTSAGHVYRIAGGAPFAVSSWSLFGGVQPYVTVDQWDIDNITNPAAHLNTAPVDGTVVEGLPSNSYWSFSAGLRSPVSATATAVRVDDRGLAVFPLKASGTGTSGSGSKTTTSGSGGKTTASGSRGKTSTSGSGTNTSTSGSGSNASTGCVVPRLKQMTLSQAKTALTRASCRLGKAHRPRHAPHQGVLRITAQSATAGSRHTSGYSVNVTLSAARQ